MDDIIKINSVSDYNKIVGVETLHPLVSVVDFEKAKPFHFFRSQLGIYAIFIKDTKCGNMTYGCGTYDYEEGTLIFLAPGQVYGIEDKNQKQKGVGKALLFHPDLIHGTSLAKNMKEYTFFSYEVNEALHLSARERSIIDDCIEKIRFELEHAIDKHSRILIVTYIELFLNYCKRFYDRQYITRNKVNLDVLAKFEKILDDYFASDLLVEHGTPTVAYCASKLFLSPNYFSDLLKRETGKSALESIQFKLIEVAKEKIHDETKSITDIAYELGFKYPQHFSRMFKKETGVTPNEYRSLN